MKVRFQFVCVSCSKTDVGRSTIQYLSDLTMAIEHQLLSLLLACNLNLPPDPADAVVTIPCVCGHCKERTVKT